MKPEGGPITDGGRQPQSLESQNLAAAGGPARPRPARRGAPDLRSTRSSKLKDAIKTFLWVLPLTALIWVYAEREQITTLPERQVTIRLKTSLSDRVVTMLTPEDRKVFLELRGPLNSLESVWDALADSKYTLDVTIPDDVQLPYRGPVAIAESIARNPLLVKEAVTVSRVMPATVTVLIEKKESITVPVQIRSEDLARIGGTVEFLTDKVAVEGPASLLEGPKPEVFADMKKVLDLPQGPHLVDVPVEVAGEMASAMAPKPAVVRAKVTIKAPEERVLRQSIPVLVQLNGQVLQAEEYHFKIEPPMLADIKVTGAPSAMDELDKLLKDDRKFPAAIVDIAPRDLTAGIPLQKRLTPEDFRMPKGITVTNGDLRVQITITRKSDL